MLYAQAQQSGQLPTDQPVCAHAAHLPRVHSRFTFRPHSEQAPPVARERCLQGVHTPAQQRRTVPHRVQAITWGLASR
ncbi:hypothetical protein [Leekyejoonella antrihumi]|uniref:Uncharacterized protein n=1 Tax=Leekyejoonella antrihumi TaxID=1660198 RepID=A0A563DPE5_9MICO|nr:hypothetical protein [Leekyejoonella antrihumi]TWP32075.1 hypothetical protein FGL98_24710 [Leekyejoonella antrihumi]